MSTAISGRSSAGVPVYTTVVVGIGAATVAPGSTAGSFSVQAADVTARIVTAAASSRTAGVTS